MDSKNSVDLSKKENQSEFQLGIQTEFQPGIQAGIQMSSEIHKQFYNHLEMTEVTLLEQQLLSEESRHQSDEKRHMEAAHLRTNEEAEHKNANEQTSDSHLLNLDLAIVERDDVMRVEAVRALNKIKMGIYGVCESCEDEIPFERLEVVPATRFCLDCEEEEETMKKQGSSHSHEDFDLSHSYLTRDFKS